MAEEHIGRELLGRFLQVEVSKEESRNVVRHLLTGCPECAELAHRLSAELCLWGRTEGVPAIWEERYEEVFRRALVFATEEEQRTALEKLRGGQWAALERLNPQARFALVETDPAYHTFGLYDRLLEASRWSMHTSPADAVDVVRLAILVAERLNAERFGAGRIADLRAAAWAVLGNVERLASNFEGSRRAFNEAWRILEEEGTNDPAERAHIIGLETGYMRDMGEFETAETALEEALQLYQQLGDRHMQGRTLVKMANAIGDIDPERGLAHLRRAIPLISTGTETRLDLCVQHDLAWYLNDSGHPEEALVVLEEARPLYRQFPDEWTQLRLHWLEGRIARNLGELSEAESTYEQLWDELRIRNLNHELVLVSVDLAETLVKKGEANRAAELVEECFPVMKAWGLHTYGLAAWLVFQQALAEHKVGDIFCRIREYYLRHWVHPAEFQ